MGREDEGNRAAAFHDRRTRRQGNRLERHALHSPVGPYAKAYAKLKAKGLQLHWQSAPAGQQAKAISLSTSIRSSGSFTRRMLWAKRNLRLARRSCASWSSFSPESTDRRQPSSSITA